MVNIHPDSELAPSTDVLDRLRTETRTLHQRVEQRVDLPRRCASLEEYRRLLVKMFSLHTMFETVLSGLDWTNTGLHLDRRRKAHLIRADLESLDKGSVQQPLPCNVIPSVNTLAAGFGCLYVIEGSTLGGQFILRQVRNSLHVGPQSGASFFASYGPDVGSMWRAFGEAARNHCTNELRIREAIAAAINTFEAFEVGLGATP